VWGIRAQRDLLDQACHRHLYVELNEICEWMEDSIAGSNKLPSKNGIDPHLHESVGQAHRAEDYEIHQERDDNHS